MNFKINGFVTEVCNGRHITPNQRKFLEEAARINIEEKRPFACYDFEQMSGTNFRQMIYRLDDVIEIAYKSNPCQYRIRGAPWQKKPHPVTVRPTGDRMINILKNLKEQPVKIHDIKLKLYSNLHDFIPHDDIDPNNHGIKKKLQLDQQTHATVLIYPNMLQIDIACTNEPIVYDISGIIRLTMLLAQLYTTLQYWSNFRASITPLLEWTITHYHFGMDGSEARNGQTFHVEYGDFATGLIRFYSKKIGETWRPRLEQVQTPRISLYEEIDKIISLQSQNNSVAENLF